ncbi:metal-dependent carboxypeptidase [Natrialba magadii ATCC 43099]|uniref:Metal-dependent carboxypeptidase n=1 Tax=Natrialba magadii (strain ATCC 43099 / DSM 3394 / CCM 3739 / CIP 104546 / IAM 13178 / JCM 8861 / NBRC 102185 / NCIMB 2190 / MS3) TaxID=547559 RepID=D3STU7_NATMM|nr:carboxypeptidase M32 [Natrialba magadii]ADD05114.1 metal-dependent carboxypeptidase [Natrialba magadii ATCC 43099]ELY23349.1 carboxypeptidase Taq [Natrialba magadii ATCC 43099]
MSADQAQPEGEGSTYDEFETRIERISNISNAAGVLRWDQEVVMPEEGTPARAKQLSTLSSISHELLTADETGELLAELEENDLNEEQTAAVREVRRRYDRETSVPQELVEEISETTANAHPKWMQAKEEDDFEAFAPTLEKLVELKREYANHIDPDADPYEVLFADYEPYLDLDTAERVLERLRDELVPLIDAIQDSDADIETDAFAGEFDDDDQEALARDVLDSLEYDWSRGRLDTAPHPFSSGTQYDARVTTRFEEDDLLGSITSVIHEFGHANYTLGLPDEHYGTPLGESRDLTVHESQSRLWENHVGRSRPFWEHFLPIARERFDELADVSPEAAYEAANQVYDDNLIRVEADELTYHLHIVIRFEVERELISGNLAVEDVPEVWNDKYEEYLGVRPETDAEGCLQDIHWSHGSFGYFPTYSLGSVLAAQLYAAAEDDIGGEATASEEPSGDEPRGAFDDQIRAGEFDDLNGWLRENIHQHGKRYTTPDLIEDATGEGFTADYFLEYAKSKYGELYELDDY